MSKTSDRQEIREFLGNTLTVDEIYGRLKKDFAANGNGIVTPGSPFFDNPPNGLGYSGPQEFQLGFLNPFINSGAGKARYNQSRSDDVYVSEIKPRPTVGNLALRLYSDQIK